MANGNGSNGSGGAKEKVAAALDKTDETIRGSQAWNSIFRPGSVYRRGYTDSPRNRSYVIMNNVLYHLHPVKVKRHAVKVSYTLCLGGLSFFLFILLTVTGPSWLSALPKSATRRVARRRGTRSSGPGRSSARATPTVRVTAPT